MLDNGLNNKNINRLIAKVDSLNQYVADFVQCAVKDRPLPEKDEKESYDIPYEQDVVKLLKATYRYSDDRFDMDRPEIWNNFLTVLTHTLIAYKFTFEISKNLIKDFEVDDKILFYAGILHDLGKVSGERRRHNVSSKDAFLEMVDKGYINEELDPVIKGKICEAILNHKGNELQEYGILNEESVESYIVHDADKLSKFYKDGTWEEIKESLEVNTSTEDIDNCIGNLIYYVYDKIWAKLLLKGSRKIYRKCIYVDARPYF